MVTQERLGELEKFVMGQIVNAKLGDVSAVFDSNKREVVLEAKYPPHGALIDARVGEYPVILKIGKRRFCPPRDISCTVTRPYRLREKLVLQDFSIRWFYY